MKRLAYIICLAELFLLIALPVGSWLASVLGCNISNPVSEEGFRWLFYHGALSLVSLQLSYIIFLLSAIGAVQQSGIVSDILKPDITAEPLSEKQRRARRRAMIVAVTFQLVVLIGLVMPAFLRHSALLGVTGGIIPSPWSMGFPLALFVSVIVTSLIYSAMCGRLGGLLGIPQHITVGISKYGAWILVAMLGTLLVRMLKYVILDA